MTITVLITARMKSTRLPKKALLSYKGKALIQYQIERLRSIVNIRIIICTSWLSQDDPLEDMANKTGVECYRGEPEDVISRYYNCTSNLNLNNFLITYSDEPFLDLSMIVETSKLVSKITGPVWVDNSKSIDGTFCYGLNKDAIEIMSKRKESINTEVWGPLAKKLNITRKTVPQNIKVNKKNIRLTIDYLEDYEVFKILAKKFFINKFDRSLDEIVDYYVKRNLYKINLFRTNDYQNRLLLQEKNTLV
jgi:spore coat polysaccharide biosynthesis protein SpsF